jgi:hypothetical protein
MNKTTPQKLVFTLALALVLVACESNPTPPVSTAPAQAELQFVDMQGFDRDLASSLSAPLPKVEVAFYDHITPSAMPERLQHWMASVQAGGGTVKVVPPKSSVTPKNPFLLISAISTIWSASKMVKEISTQSQFKTAQDFDAEIILKTDDKGDSLVDKVVFVHRKK